MFENLKTFQNLVVQHLMLGRDTMLKSLVSWMKLLLVLYMMKMMHLLYKVLSCNNKEVGFLQV